MEHHGRKHRATGGVNEAERDVEDKPEERTNARHIDAEVMERKHGGKTEHKRAHRAHDGKIHGEEHHHPSCECKKCKGGRVERKRGGHVEHKHEEMKMHGEHAKHHAGRMPRKSGGRATSDANPFTSARRGEVPKGREVMDMD
jgi:hypothetical protein